MTNITLPQGYIKNRSLHAYLFTSPDCTVRHETARLMAMSMMCRETENGVACGKCRDCIKMLAGTHPDCTYLGAEKLGVDDVRGIENEAYLSTNEALCKVFVLENADLFNVQSQNALLKIIEEPPKNVRFILTAASKTAILPTVRSRVCILSGTGRTLSMYESAVLSAHKGIDPTLAKRLASFAMNYDGTEIEKLDTAFLGDAFNLALKFYTGDENGAVLMFPKKREELMLYLQVFMLAAGNILVCRATGRCDDGVFTSDELKRSCAKTSQKRAVSLYDTFESAYLHADAYSNINALVAYIAQNV